MIGQRHHPAPPFPAMQDLFALLDEPEVRAIHDPLSFTALQDKARREGVKGLSAQEKAAYLQFLQRKAATPIIESPLPSSSQTRAVTVRLPAYRAGQESMTYAGIGSRDTPENVRATIQKIAVFLERKGYTLQTGDALGADSAFASGCERKRIFTVADAADLPLEIAKEVHPAPWMLPPYAKRLMARTTCMVYGPELDTPVDFVLCWTDDGCNSHTTRKRETGDTGQAIELASRKGIPVINIQNVNWQDQLKEALANAGRSQDAHHFD